MTHKIFSRGRHFPGWKCSILRCSLCVQMDSVRMNLPPPELSQIVDDRIINIFHIILYQDCATTPRKGTGPPILIITLMGRGVWKAPYKRIWYVYEYTYIMYIIPRKSQILIWFIEIIKLNYLLALNNCSDSNGV